MCELLSLLMPTHCGTPNARIMGHLLCIGGKSRWGRLYGRAFAGDEKVVGSGRSFGGGLGNSVVVAYPL